jgi:hypothetical protein
MKYLTFIRHSESYRQSGPPAALMEAMGKFVEKSLKDGTLVDTGGLLPSKDGVRVRLGNGEITVIDGPFTESKEVIGGWAILNVDSTASRRCGRCSTPAWGRSTCATARLPSAAPAD